ncbi:MFS transporter [Lacticaseibacillus rhamnosus]|uniref:MFS transporter n=1 Tax=Lacticaseibacillus rhamnosus TaxID=47715 RepID=UPI0039F4BFD2
MSTSTKPQGRGLVMAAVFIATFMTSVEVTIVTTALPAIISDLHGLAYQSWIMSAYLLTTAITTPIYGKLADTLGRRGVFQWGVVLFTLGTLLSGLAPHILLLILARALQGIGAVGYREPRREHVSLTIDWLGIAWLAVTLVALLLGIQALDQQPWLAALLIVLAIVGGYLLIRQEHRAVDPLIAPQMFHRFTFTVQILTALLLSGVLIGYQVYFPIWLQSLYHLGATAAGLVVTSSSVLWLTSSFLVDPLIKRMVPRTLTLGLVTILTLAYLLLTFASSSFPVWAFYVIAMINGTVMGIVISMNTVLSQHLVPDRYVGSATSILTLGRSLGQTIMTGVYGAVLTLVIRANLHGTSFKAVNAAISANSATTVHDPHAAAAILTGLHGVFIMVVIIMLLVIVINWRDPNRDIIQ